MVEDWYQREGAVFEFYDALNNVPPTVLMRKGTPSGGVRDYHWTASLIFDLLLEFYVT